MSFFLPILQGLANKGHQYQDCVQCCTKQSLQIYIIFQGTRDPKLVPFPSTRFNLERLCMSAKWGNENCKSVYCLDHELGCSGPAQLWPVVYDGSAHDIGPAGPSSVSQLKPLSPMLRLFFNSYARHCTSKSQNTLARRWPGLSSLYMCGADISV